MKATLDCEDGGGHTGCGGGHMAHTGCGGGHTTQLWWRAHAVVEGRRCGGGHVTGGGHVAGGGHGCGGGHTGCNGGHMAVVEGTRLWWRANLWCGGGGHTPVVEGNLSEKQL